LWRMASILTVNKVHLFVSSVLFVFWYHSPNVLDTPHKLSPPGYKSLLLVPSTPWHKSRRHGGENVNGDYVEVWYAPPTNHVPCTRQRIIKAPGITENVTILLETPLYLFVQFNTILTLHRVRKNYRSILQNHIFTNFFAHVQTGPGAHPASCTKGTGSFQGVKRPGRGADHPPHLAPRSKRSRATPLLPL
jgi:hypothetical protein